MKLITDISQLTPEDVGTVVEVLQLIYDANDEPKVICIRGVYHQTDPLKRTMIIINRQSPGRYYRHELYTREGSFPVNGSQGARTVADEGIAQRCASLLEGIEMKREVRPEEIK